MIVVTKTTYPAKGFAKPNNALAENFSPEGRAELQNFVNEELFGDALSYIDTTHDLPSSGSCDWTSQAAQAEDFATKNLMIMVAVLTTLMNPVLLNTNLGVMILLCVATSPHV